MPFTIIRNDITNVKADAIVNTANPQPTYAGGTDSAIYHAAGEEELLAARKKIGRIARGEAAATPAFRLPAKYIIHTVGPSWIDGHHGEEETLRSCYRKSLLLAEQLKCRSIAFPLIATGIYGFPRQLALEIAGDEIEKFLQDSDMKVKLVVFGKESFQLASRLQQDIDEYIDENYERAQASREYYGRNADMCFIDAAAPSCAPAMERKERRRKEKRRETLDDLVNHPGETFQKRLFRMIDARGLDDPEVYHKANIDRKLFSKIRCSEDYIPKKNTVLALCLGLELNLDETRDLLASAGWTLTNSSKTDIIVRYCIENGIHDLYDVNTILVHYQEKCL